MVKKEVKYMDKKIDYIIETVSLTKRFGEFKALDSLNLKIKK